MALPPLYKYLDCQGAKLTLSNRTFKHAKPSDFNDSEELTVQSIFPDEIEAALRKLNKGYVDIILQHLNDKPTCSPPKREKIAALQCAFRKNPNVAETINAELKKEGIEQVYDIEHIEAYRNRINAFMQDYRILCVSTNRDSEKMWSRYAENHKGIVLRVEPNVVKDSKFQHFRPVDYQKNRPPLYDGPQEFLADHLFGDREASNRAAIEKIIYTKTLSWQYEAEYRLVDSLQMGEPPWNEQKYYPEEITELYLGLAITREDKKDIIKKGASLNPKILIFQVERNSDALLTFNQI